MDLSLTIVVFSEEQFYTYYCLHDFVNLNLLPTQTKELSFPPLLKNVIASSPGSLCPSLYFLIITQHFFLKCEEDTAQDNGAMGTAVFSASAKLYPSFCSQYPF